MKKVPIGVDNFHKLVTGGYLFCDKTAMIAEFLSKGEEVTLITRPRRWGKTLNMSMLLHFFAAEVYGIKTAGLFDHLQISFLEGGRYIREHQGQAPVIMVSFKDIHADDFQGAYESIYLLIKQLYGSYEYLLKSDCMNSNQKNEFQAILDKVANQQQLEKSLQLLSACLYQHHGKQVYIFIDEYDTPLNQAYEQKDYLDALVKFMRNWFSAGLKGNNALQRGVLTGILRVSKDSMLSGLNNLETYTLLDNEYSSCFGFSEAEMRALFVQQGVSVDFDQVQGWYNGYTSGDAIAYNPWSILSCINRSGRFDVYWVNTGNNNLIKDRIFRAQAGIKAQFEQLMEGTSIQVSINKHLAFDLLEQDETALWSLLLFAGYLKAESVCLSDSTDLYDCQVAIPNNEIQRLYNHFFKEWLSREFSYQAQYDSFLKHLASGKVALFMRDLSGYLLQSASSFDVTGSAKSEGFYHGFVLALLASLRTTHVIRSNRESGFGRYDLLLVPKNETNDIGLLLEFKHVKKEEPIEAAARSALGQIQARAYHAELLQPLSPGGSGSRDCLFRQSRGGCVCDVCFYNQAAWSVACNAPVWA